jgi:N-acylneuraminate cytidylyltransferase
VVTELAARENYHPDAVVMLYGNVPIRRKRMIDRCIHLLRWHGCDSVQTVAPVGKMHPYWMFHVEQSGGQLSKYQPNAIYRRQDLPPLFMPTGAVYVMTTAALMAAEGATDPHAFLGADRRGLLTDADDSVDIDTPRDLALAELMLREENV